MGVNDELPDGRGSESSGRSPAGYKKKSINDMVFEISDVASGEGKGDPKKRRRTRAYILRTLRLPADCSDASVHKCIRRATQPHAVGCTRPQCSQ